MLFTQATLAEHCQHLPGKVAKSIKAYANQVRGAEYCEYRLVARGDIDLDGMEDIVVIFTVEGACFDDKENSPGACGNNAFQYMKAYLGKNLKEVRETPVGNSTVRGFVNALTIKNGIIYAGTTRYSLKSGSLIEHPKTEHKQ